MRNNPILYEQMKVRGEDNYAPKLTCHKTNIYTIYDTTNQAEF